MDSIHDDREPVHPTVYSRAIANFVGGVPVIKCLGNDRGNDRELSMELDYLFLCAHPDDAELFCGGSIARFIQEGRQVGVLDLTRGESGTSGTVAERDAETAAANEILGLSQRWNLGLPDGGLEDNLEARKGIVDIIRSTRVKVLIATWGPCRHPDHTAVHNLARSCYFYSGNGKFPSDHPIWRPKQVIFHPELHQRPVSFVVDITDQFEARMLALQCYGSQFYSPETGEKPTYIGSIAFMDSIKARYAYYGSLINRPYGEPYITDGALRVDDPVQTFVKES